MIQVDRILVPTDFSEASTDAVRMACELSAKFGAELHLLHVLEDHAISTPMFAGGLALSQWVQESRSSAEKSLSEAIRPDWVVPERIHRLIAEGRSFVEIVRYARNHEIDLIVMGTHGRGGITHALLGSVAERVVRKAGCPVLTVPRPDSDQSA